MKFPPKPPFVLLDNSQAGPSGGKGLLFSNPARIIQCRTLNNVGRTLGAMQRALDQGFYLAGWISYEAGYAFHPTIKKKDPKLLAEPLIWMGVFEKPKSLSREDLANQFQTLSRRQPPAGFMAPPKPGQTQTGFNNKFKAIQALIRAGDIYQANYTFPIELSAFGPLVRLYGALREKQPTAYGAYIETGNQTVLSFSPELFITRTGATLISKPMKGTARPSPDLKENLKRMKDLKGDEKNRAENLMITDLIRNDFSRICQPGSVRVSRLFDVEKYKTVLQMTSEVRGALKPGITFPDIFKALFPCGSVTGAPKIRAMEVIHDLEGGPRGIYTGALGYLSPSGDFTFNVPIRTAVFDNQGKGRLRVGSGIVAQSKSGDEFRECLLKANFLKGSLPRFALIETMMWDPFKGYVYLNDHLGRLQKSAAYFDFKLDLKVVRKSLRTLEKTFAGDAHKKVRLTLGRAGTLSLETKPFAPPSQKRKKTVAVSKVPVYSGDIFLYHKTTHRALYALELKKAQKNGHFDVIFLNENREITEAAFNSVFIKGNRGPLLTPPLKSGLLPGVLRNNLLQNGLATERSLTCDDLKKARKIYLGNSVNGLVEVSLS